MKRPILIVLPILIALPALLISGAVNAQSAQPAQKKNVLFIIADDLNCNMGAYGHYLVETPNIDKLAGEGLLFEQAFCNFPLCGPSRNSLLTGLYPDQTGLVKLRDMARDHVPDVITMPQNFMRAGYESARVGKIFHYDNPKGIGTPGHDDPASWDRRVYPSGRDKAEEDKIFSLSPGRFGATLSWLAAEGTDEEQTDGMVATESIKLLKKYAQEKTPFFLAVGFYKPHTPFVAPKKYFDKYPLDRDLAKVWNGEMDVSLLNEGLLNPPDKEYTGLDNYPYSGTCAWIDNEWKLYQKGAEFELYNLKTDKSEKRNVAGQYPGRVASMKKALLAWQQSVIKSIRGGDY